ARSPTDCQPGADAENQISKKARMPGLIGIDLCQPAFARYIGIDYSGAQTPTASLSGLRVYMAEGDALPVEVSPPASRRKYWSRRGIAEWLAERLAEQVPTLVGIDHGFSFPLRYFEAYGLKPDWPAFLDDFQRHWPTDDDHTYVREGGRPLRASEYTYGGGCGSRLTIELTAASDRLISCSSCWDFPTASGSLEHKPATSLTRVITHELQRRGQHLASVLQEGRENTNIDAGLGFIWRISVKAIS